MRRQAEAQAKHPRKVIFRQRTQPGQLPEADRLSQLIVDELHQLPALMRCESALQAQALTRTDLVEQGVADQFVGEAAGQQAFGWLFPVQAQQSAKALGLLRIFEKGLFAQLHLARLAIEQRHATEGELFGAEIQVRQTDVAIDHPARFMLGRQDAQLVGPTLATRLATAKCASAAGDVAGQGVMTRRFIFLGVVVIGPQSRRQAVAELGAVHQTCIRRAVEGLKDLQGIDGGHVRFSSTPSHPTP